MITKSRIEILMQGLEVNEVQAFMFDKLLEDIPTDKLIDFLAYRLNFVGEYKSKELATTEAIREYKKLLMLKDLRSNRYKFKDINKMISWIKANFKNQDIGRGLGAYKKKVIIGLDKDLNLVNKNVVNENGVFKRLDSEDTTMIWQYLFKHQEKIGVVDYSFNIYDEKNTRLPQNQTETPQIQTERVKGIVGVGQDDKTPLNKDMERLIRVNRF